MARVMWEMEAVLYMNLEVDITDPCQWWFDDKAIHVIRHVRMLENHGSTCKELFSYIQIMLYLFTGPLKTHTNNLYFPPASASRPID